MYAERLILETDQSGHIKNYQKFPQYQKFEVIFLGMDEENKIVKREPHPDIAGKVEIIGNVFDSAPVSDWNSSL